MRDFFIGVDGGATKCIVRLEDEEKRLLGQEIGGPANIRNSIEDTWQSIYTCINKMLHSFSLSFEGACFHVGMGLAGCEVLEAYQAFVKCSHPFKTLVVSSDSHIACLAAHQGGDGAIIIAGTGVVGFQMEVGKTAQVGGWGFPLDDEGGGAWLGLCACRMTLRWLDGRIPVSSLTKKIYAHFSEDQHQLIYFANNANSTQFAELAPLVIQHAKAGDTLAIQLMQQAACAIDEIGLALYKAQKQKNYSLPCSLVGGVASFLEPYLGETLRARLRPFQLPPAAGAILLVRNEMSLLGSLN